MCPDRRRSRDWGGPFGSPAGLPPPPPPPWQHCKHEEGECPCAGHSYDNQSNWDMTRRHFCDTLNDQAEKDHPFPDELKYTLDLTFTEGLDENGNDKVPYEPLNAGALDLGLV